MALHHLPSPSACSSRALCVWRRHSELHVLNGSVHLTQYSQLGPSIHGAIGVLDALNGSASLAIAVCVLQSSPVRVAVHLTRCSQPGWWRHLRARCSRWLCITCHRRVRAPVGLCAYGDITLSFMHSIWLRMSRCRAGGLAHSAIGVLDALDGFASPATAACVLQSYSVRVAPPP